MTVPSAFPRQIRRRPVIRLLVAAALLLTCVAALGQSPARAEPGPSGRWPLAPAPELVARFDPPASDWGSGHRGVDLLGASGQSVRAALPGRVSFAGRIAGRGIVVVDHGDTRTTYEPVRSTREVGATVAAGARIGRLELFGSHCFPRSCLHWGWIRGTTYLDPLLLVGAGPVRLLPLWGALPQETSPGLWPQARGCACW